MTKTQSKTPPTDPKAPSKDAGGGKTKVEQGGESAPRLPHEHDQSSDSQQTQDGQPPKVGRQAHDDVERGVVDTDRGPEADRVYNDKVRR
ncbi:hypothetical protein NU688_20755 [Variovorax sp. ZS18.2.2]|uniref:hypothetical protein n=1 Tax=Variovorax sp. ZS18.2.2 TaxID=2971255 RepID=UPI002151AF92|nr:hypothetical protein [Variovorax sp. ZS18.2.2]MCR6478599.1 hypothetical protein [Variovorax sp. ZS18.2.2]